LPSNGPSLQSHYLATDLYATVRSNVSCFASHLFSVQTGSGPTQPPIQWVPESSFPGGKAAAAGQPYAPTALYPHEDS
jgi:hypothetical protein